MLELHTTIHTARVPVNTITPGGNIDSSTFNLFQACVEEQLTNGAQYVLLNFRDTDYISSAGLRVIHNLFNSLRNLHNDVNDDDLRKQMSAGMYKSPYLKICCLSGTNAEVFRLAGFDIYIEIFDDESKAINSF